MISAYKNPDEPTTCFSGNRIWSVFNEGRDTSNHHFIENPTEPFPENPYKPRTNSWRNWNAGWNEGIPA